ncbi:MAG: YeeE/YedE thiosulfate transporter family protein [Planctomycetota bacterium]
MDRTVVRKAPLAWWVGGLLLGLTQVMAVAIKKPLGVSTQFVVADTLILQEVRPEWVTGHPLIDSDKYTTTGYSWWLDAGLISGAFLAALCLGRWRLGFLPAWARVNHQGWFKRLLLGFVGGFLILLGARLGHGCTSGQFASGWAQLSLSTVPFTVTMFAFGIAAAWLFYRKSPTIEKGD